MMPKIDLQKSAGLLAVITLLSMWCVVLFVGYSFIDTSLAVAAVLRHGAGLPGIEEVSAGRLRIMMVVGLPAILVQLYILNAVRALFSLYSCGIFLTEENGKAITRIGIGLIILPVVRFVLEPVWTVILTHGAEQMSMSVSFSSTGVGLMLGGLLMLLIGQSMFEASRVRQEYEAFV